MKEISLMNTVYKILQKNYGMTGQLLKSAKEIASLVREFDEWKDIKLIEGLINLHTKDGGYWYLGLSYTHDELFNYWYDNIYKK